MEIAETIQIRNSIKLHFTNFHFWFKHESFLKQVKYSWNCVAFGYDISDT